MFLLLPSVTWAVGQPAAAVTPPPPPGPTAVVQTASLSTTLTHELPSAEAVNTPTVSETKQACDGHQRSSHTGDLADPFTGGNKAVKLMKLGLMSVLEGKAKADEPRLVRAALTC